MPELPEVEVVARQLRERLVGRRFTDAKVRQPKSINLPPGEFRERFRQSIKGVERRGKSVVLSLETDDLWIHRGLSGIVALDPPGTPAPEKEPIVTLDLDDGSRLRLERLFMGHAHLLNHEASAARAAEAGVDALTGATSAWLREMVRQKPNLAAKALLMDQSLIVGVGNSYSDEILHEAGLNPGRKLGTFSTAELDALLQAIGAVLREAISLGGDESYPDLDGKPGRFRSRVHNQMVCGSCGRSVERLAKGKGGYYCPACQR